MTTGEKEDSQDYKVVVNHEGQYSIWPSESDNPPGWEDGGMRGSKAACLRFVSEVWTDMRPASLKRAVEQAGQNDE